MTARSQCKPKALRFIAQAYAAVLIPFLPTQSQETAPCDAAPPHPVLAVLCLLQQHITFGMSN